MSDTTNIAELEPGTLLPEEESFAPPANARMADKVIIRRFPDAYTLVGPPIVIKDLDEACEQLAQNPWMQNWLAARVKEAILRGEIFCYFKRVVENWRGRPDGLISEYRQATESEVLDYVDTSAFASTTGHAVSRRAQEARFILHYHEGIKLIEAYDKLPRQAKVILDLMAKTERDSFTEASIEVILTENIEELHTKQAPIKIFGFYRARLIEEGHLEEDRD